MASITLLTSQLVIVNQHLEMQEVTTEQSMVVYDIQSKVRAILDKEPSTQAGSCPVCQTILPGGLGISLAKLVNLPQEVRVRQGTHEFELSESELSYLNGLYKNLKVPTNHDFLEIYIPLVKALKKA